MKRFEATASRLERNPEYAKAYDTQIMEMNDLNFARKLEEKEINDYNGPIHYIAHHSVVKSQSKSTPIRIVFNSSSVSKVQIYTHSHPVILHISTLERRKFKISRQVFTLL